MIDGDELDWRIGTYVREDGWEEDCTLAGPTETPGVFYHGSPNPNIATFQGASAVFFTHNPSYAAFYAAKDGCGGRIYRAGLATKNPMIVSNPNDWSTAVGLDQIAEAKWISKARESGFDSIITLHRHGTITEIIVLDERIIKTRETSSNELTDFGKCNPLDYHFAFQAPSQAGPDYAPDATMLFGDLRRAKQESNRASRVAIRPACPVYCNQAAWEQLDGDILRYVEIDCLIDPETSNALALDPELILPINRRAMKSLAAKKRRA